jgi:hypothetical protein
VSDDRLSDETGMNSGKKGYGPMSCPERLMGIMKYVDQDSSLPQRGSNRK